MKSNLLIYKSETLLFIMVGSRSRKKENIVYKMNRYRYYIDDIMKSNSSYQYHEDNESKAS